MNTSKVSGDSKIVMGSPIPKEDKHITIPPEKSGMKVIEAGEIELSVEKNTPELLRKLEERKGREH